jgi:hypothetical protein
MLPEAWLDAWDPMTNFRGAAFHRECWSQWKWRDRFVERVNSTGSGYRMAIDGHWEFVGERIG